MSKFAELPDGTKLEFPDDTEDSVIDKTVKAHLGISAPTTEKSDAQKFGDWALDKAGGAVGALSALPDYLAGAVKMAGAVPIQAGLMAMGNNASDARPASQQVMEEFIPSLGPNLKAILPESMQQGAQHGYDAMMAPMEGLTQLMALPGKGVQAATGNKDLAAGTDLAVDAAMLLSPFAKKVGAPKPAPIPEGAKVGPAYGKPLMEKGIPTNFDPKQVADSVALNKEIQAELDRQNKVPKPLEPEGDVIGAQFGGRDAKPWDTPLEVRERSPLEMELVPKDERGLFGDNPRATPQEALKTTHDYPTIDFPLRQEVLEQPEIKQAIDAFRAKDAELTQVVDNAISEAVRNKAKEQRDALREEFGRGMELLGINKASDAYGRGLYEARGNETTGAVQHTHNAGRMGKSQEGALKIFQKGEDRGKWEERMRAGIPGISDQRLNEMWQERGGIAKSTAATAKINKGILPTTGDDIKITRLSQEDALNSLLTSEDSKSSDGGYRTTFMPGGYMPAEFTKNPGLKAGFTYLKSLIDEHARKAESVLFRPQKGIINSLTKLETLFGPGNAKEILKQMFEAKDNPLYEFKLTPEQTKVHEMLKKQFESMLEDINKYLPENRKLDELPNYIPSIHDGKWYVQVVPKDSTTGKPILYGSHNKFQLAAIKKWLETQGHDVGNIKTRGKITNKYGDVNDVKAANYQYMLDVLTNEDPATQALGKAIVKGMESDAYTAAGVNQRFKDYHGYQGNLGNNPLKSGNRNYYDAKKMIINSVEAHYSWVAAQEAAAFGKAMMEHKVPEHNMTILNDYIDHNVIGKNPKTVVDSVVNAITEATMGMDASQTTRVSGRVGNIVTAFATAMGSPVHALQNVVQPITVIMPHIFKEGGTYLDVVNAMTKAPAEYLYVGLGKQLGEIGKLLGADAMNVVGTKNFDKKMKYATETGIIDPTIVESSPMFDSKVINRGVDFAMQGVLSRPSEQAARWTVFSTMYDLGIRKGLSTEKAAQRAKEITETYMVDYGPDAKPRIFAEGGILGNTMGRLQTFASNQIAQTFLYLKNAKNSPQDFGAAAAYLGTIAALGGLTGLPFFDVFEKTVNALKAKDGNTYSLRNEIRQSVGDGAVGGIWDKMGLGVAPSFASRTIGDNGLPAMLGFPTLQIMGQAGETALRRLNPNTSWETEPESEKGKELQSIAPRVAREYIADKYLKNKVGDKEMYVSGKTGEPVHPIQPNEFTFGNIRSAERAKDADLTNQKYLERAQWTKQKKDIEADVTSRMYDFAYGHGNEAKLEKLNQQLGKYIKLGHTEQDLQNLQEKITAKIAIGDAELERLKTLAERRQDLEFVHQFLQEVKYRNLKGSQKGIFNFGVSANGR